MIKKYKSQLLFFAIFALCWQSLYWLHVFPGLLFPSVPGIVRAFIDSFSKENMFSIIFYSLKLILAGMATGLLLGLILSALTVVWKKFLPVYHMVVAICDPLPGIALLPLAILWFGIGENTILFIIVHSVIWPMSRNMIDGFSATPPIYLEVGRNFGLSRLELVKAVYLPSSLPYLISGVKVGWARAWRALISAEMIFGISGSSGGLGWYIYTKRYRLETEGVFASLLVIILIGVVIEYGIFSRLEKRTVRKWGMVR